MIDHLSNDQLLIAMVSMVWAGALMYKFRRYLTPRRQDDTIRQHLGKAETERQADLAAAANVFGSRWPTLANLIGISLIAAASTRWGLDIANYSGAYLVLGAIVTKRLAMDRRPVEYERLSWGNRAWYRLYFCWLWPLRSSTGASESSPE